MAEKETNRTVLVELQHGVNTVILEIIPPLKRVQFGGDKFNKKLFVNTAVVQLLEKTIKESADIGEKEKKEIIERIRKL